MEKTELLFVRRRQLNLQLDIITDICVNSTNQSVAAIAFESIPSFFASDPQRALSLQDELHGPTLQRLTQFIAEPRSLETAAYLSRVVWIEAANRSAPREQLLERLNAIMRCMLKLPDIKLGKIRDWHYEQFIRAIEYSKVGALRDANGKWHFHFMLLDCPQIQEKMQLCRKISSSVASLIAK